MDLRNAAGLLGMSIESVEVAVTQGICMDGTGDPIVLEVDTVAGEWDFSDVALEAFVAARETHEPGRHPPIAVRRELLVEAGYQCAACGDGAPLEFHHIVEFSEVKHHDPQHMLAVCGTCHTKMTRGLIDRRAQLAMKERMSASRKSGNHEELAILPLRFDWDDLRAVIEGLHKAREGMQDLPDAKLGSVKFDFTSADLEEKNRINRLGADYFKVMKEKHEPYFHRIDDFLGNPRNEDVRERYLDLADTLRNRIAMSQGQAASFEQVLISLRERAQGAIGKSLRGRMELLSAVLSYMYIQCDIGRTS